MGYTIQEHLLKINSHTRPGTKLSGVKGIVIHWTANEGKNANADAHFNYFNKGTVYASAHYFVDSTKILRIIPENEVAYHVGAVAYKTTKYGSYPNAHMIGVEICVNPESDFKVAYKKAVWLCADLLKRHKLGINNLERHFDITGKDCPKFFVTDATAKKYLGTTAAKAYAQFKKDVNALLTGKAKTPVEASTAKAIGTIKVLTSSLNVRKSDSFTASIVGTLAKGDTHKVYKLSNGMYKLGAGKWCSAGAAYVKFTAAKKKEPKTNKYVVKSGDTLWSIATKNKTTVDKIKSLNKLKSDALAKGQVLILPRRAIHDRD